MSGNQLDISGDIKKNYISRLNGVISKGQIRNLRPNFDSSFFFFFHFYIANYHKQKKLIV